MTDQTESNVNSETTQALAETRSQAEKLLAEMVRISEVAAAHNRDIEAGRAFATSARAELESNLTAAQVVAQSLKSHVDEASASANQVNELRNAAQAAEAAIAEMSAQANSALTSVQAAVENATGAVTRDCRDE